MANRTQEYLACLETTIALKVEAAVEQHLSGVWLGV